MSFGTRCAASLTPAEVIRWVRSKWKNEGTQGGALAGVIAAFGLAFRHGLLTRNPIGAAREEFQEGENRRAMTLPEYQALLRHAGDRAFRRYLIMLWWTGARCGELAGLRWFQVDFERRLIVLKKHKAWKKTRLPRLIPLCSVALGLLAWMHERAADPVNGLVFTNRNGNAWDAPQRSLRAMRCKMRAGVGREVVLHMMRHSFATRLPLGGKRPTPAVDQRPKTMARCVGWIDKLALDARGGRQADAAGDSMEDTRCPRQRRWCCWVARKGAGDGTADCDGSYIVASGGRGGITSRGAVKCRGSAFLVYPPPGWCEYTIQHRIQNSLGAPGGGPSRPTAGIAKSRGDGPSIPGIG